jgi:hypothetical protein
MASQPANPGCDRNQDRALRSFVPSLGQACQLRRMATMLIPTLK